MFSLTVVDHVRLDSEQAARNYTVHARAAERLARLGFSSRVVIAGLLAVSTSAAIINLLAPGRAPQIAVVVAPCGFTASAQELAASNGVHLLHHSALSTLERAARIP